MPSPLLTRRSALLVAMESTYGTLPSLSGSTDALIMSNPQYTADVAILKREVMQPSMSKLRHMTGRKISKLRFTAEPNLNNLANTGISGNAPLLSRLLRGCGMALTAKPATWVSAVLPLSYEAKIATSAMAASVSGAYASHPIGYLITCTTGGGSGVARVSITPHDLTLDTAQTGVTLTNATPFSVGSNGASITPAGLSGLVVGMQWVIILYPIGLLYTPISTGFESLGMNFYVDGSVHSMTGVFGTFTMRADAGKPVSFDFDFTGLFNAYADLTLPTVTYVSTRPPMFQSAGVSVGGFSPIIDSLTLDAGVSVVERPSANAADGLYGLMITDRMPNGGFDPEASAAASQNFWTALASATVAPVFARAGSVAGSRLFFALPSTQYSGLSYKDRNGIRAHDAAFDLSQTNGDDDFVSYIY